MAPQLEGYGPPHLAHGMWAELIVETKEIASTLHVSASSPSSEHGPPS